MHQYKQRWKTIYPMEIPSNAPPTPKSRGHCLFDRQAQLHACNSDSTTTYNSNTIVDIRPQLPALRVYHSSIIPSNNTRVSSINRNTQNGSTRSNENLNSIEKHKTEVLHQTDFPLNEPTVELGNNSKKISINPTNSLCCAMIDSAFDYLGKSQESDDDDADVIISSNDDKAKDIENENLSDGGESVDTIDLDAGVQRERANTGDFLHSSTAINNNQRQNSKERIFDHQESSTFVVHDDEDSDSENQSHDDEIDADQEQIQVKEQQMKQFRKEKILWSIAQEWLRKEEIFLEELEIFNNQLSSVSNIGSFQDLIRTLINLHHEVVQKIKHSYDHEQQTLKSIRKLTEAVETLMKTVDNYERSIEINQTPLRKALERRSTSANFSSEDFFSILPKQFLQILSQVQDLYKTAYNLESDDRESLRRLCDFSHKCKLLGSRQDENINKVILKNEDVAILGIRGNRDRCHVILYPDVIVCANLKTGLLVGAKYTVLWFIPIINLQLFVPQTAAGDNLENSSEIKVNLKTAYQELEKIASTSVADQRKARQIRRQENEYNLAQSNLQLCLSHSSSAASSRQQYSYILLFPSAYQRQDWIDAIERAQKDLVQRSSTFLDPVNAHHQRLTENLIQKRLDFVKPQAQGVILNNDNSTIRNLNKTYSGTLEITIHSLRGSALTNPSRSETSLTSAENVHYQYFVAVEIDSYKTFHPYAQTTKKSMEKNDLVEFRGEIFEIELEHSVAFRMLIYRIETESNRNHNRAQCIGKFHRNIEAALKDCSRRAGGHSIIESPNDDLKLEISLKYCEREGTFHRRRSKRNKAVFGKTIEQLMTNPSGVVDGIPRIISKCVEMVDREGLQETGIYRVCCVTSDLQKLRREYDRNQHHGEDMLTKKNVHVAANLLKLFLRELHEPLFTSNLYSDWVNAIHLADTDNQRVALLRTFENLPLDNRRILLFLLDHLLRVSKHSSVNMMHLDNLAVVFGPTLMRPSKPIQATYYSANGQNLGGSTLDLTSEVDHMSSELQGSMDQCRVVLAYLKLRQDGRLK